MMHIKKKQCYKCHCPLQKGKRTLVFFRSMCFDCFNTQKSKSPFLWLLIDKLSLLLTVFLIILVCFLFCAFMVVVFERLLPPWLSLTILLLTLIFTIARDNETKEIWKDIKKIFKKANKKNSRD